MRAMYFAVLLTLAVTLTVPAQAEQSYVWDGSSLQSVQTTQGLTCSNWAIWYFKRGASQTPGSQWGASLGRSAGEVLQDQQQGQKDDENWAVVKAKYHMRIPDDPQVHDNYLGPICVTRTAFDAKPGAVQAIESAGELAGRISSLISQIRMVLNGARVAIKTGYQGYYLQEGERNQLEEYLDNVQGIAENVGKVQNALMQHLGPTMMQINGQINTITQQLGQAEANLPAIRNLVSAQSTPAVSTAWIAKTQDFGRGGQTSFQEVAGGISMKLVSMGPTVLVNIQFNNIDHASLANGIVFVTLKAPLTGYAGGTDVRLNFTNQQDAQDSYDYLKAHIQ